MRTLFLNALRLPDPRTAMGRYIEQLVHHWSRSEIPFDRVVLLTPRPVPPESLDLGTRSEVSIHTVGSHLPLAIWEQVALPLAARGGSILFCPSYTAPLAWRGRLVLANHGIYEELPSEFSRLTRLRTIPLFRASARRAHRVIANSEVTRRDLARHFGLGEEKVEVIYPAAAEIFFRHHDPRESERLATRLLGRPGPYLLFVGKLSRRRNFPALIEAFSKVCRRLGLEHRLLAVGPNTQGLAITELAARHGAGEAVQHIPHLEQAELALLYAGADLFVLPTSYEGISWTMMEAMASGAPVLTVEHPTLDEAARGAVLVAATASVEDLAAGIERLLTDERLRGELRCRAAQAVRRFSWRRSAEATLRVLDRVARTQDER